MAVAASTTVAIPAHALDLHVPANAGRNWLRAGQRMNPGTLVSIQASGSSNVGAAGQFSPVGTSRVPGDTGFPAPDLQMRYGLAIRLTSSRDNPHDELREDRQYTNQLTFCAAGGGQLWLTVNDNQPNDNSGGFQVNVTFGSCATGLTPLASGDLQIRGLEVVQAIQNLRNEVALVEGKFTVARVYAAADIPINDTLPVQIRLHGSRSGQVLPESPIIATATAVSRLTELRRGAGDLSANIPLPHSWRSGAITLKAEVSRGLIPFADTNRANNSAEVRLQFQRLRNLCLVTVPVISHLLPGVEFRISDPAFPNIRERFSTLFPNPEIRVHELPVAFGPTNLTVDRVHTITWLRPWMVYSDAGSCATNADRFDVGLVSPDADTSTAPDSSLAGYALPSQVAWVKMSREAPDTFDQPRAGGTLAHELGHVMWWAHIPGCGASWPYDHGFPYRNGQIGFSFGRAPDVFDSGVHLGYDHLSSSVVRTDAFDFMSVCRPRWVADNHWMELFNRFADRRASLRTPQWSLVNAGFAAQPAARRVPEFIYISAILRTGKPLEWGPVFRIPGDLASVEQFRRFVPLKGPATGKPVPYTIEILDGANKVLDSRLVDLIPGHGENSDPQPSSLVAVLPAVSGMKRIRVLEGTKEIAFLSPSSDAPLQVKLSGWKKSFTAADTLKLAWDAAGGTGSLLSLVQYSADGGRTWQVIHLGRDRSALSIPAAKLPGGHTCKLRVIVSDAFRTAFDESPLFTVPTHDPVAAISGLAKRTIQQGSSLALRAFAYDSEDGELDGKALTWTVNGKVLTSAGRDLILRDLLLGSHRITLTAIDSENRKSTTSIDVFVVAKKS